MEEERDSAVADREAAEEKHTLALSNLEAEKEAFAEQAQEAASQAEASLQAVQREHAAVEAAKEEATQKCTLLLWHRELANDTFCRCGLGG